MISENQFKFLMEFIDTGIRCKNETECLLHFNREKVSVEIFKELLIKHPELYPAEPYNEVDHDDNLSGQMLIEYLNDYIKRIGLDGFFDFFEPDMYGISSKGLEELSTYKREVKIIECSQEANDIAKQANIISEKANEKSKKANIISWIALGFSILASLSGLASLVLEIIKFSSNK